jgi:hypothetical protein
MYMVFYADCFRRLIGNEETREMLCQDLKDAAAIGPHGTRRKSWQRASSIDSNNIALPRRNTRTNLQRGFQSEVALSPLMGSGHSPSPGQPLSMHDPSPAPRLFTDEELSFNPDPGNALGFGVEPGPHRSANDLLEEESAESESDDIGVPNSAYGGPVPLPDANADGEAKSPRQRRRLNNGESEQNGPLSSSAPSVFCFQNGNGGQTIPHTGTATYHLTDSAASMAPDQEEPKEMSELADVVGQLSLDENVRYIYATNAAGTTVPEVCIIEQAEVRYHGRSSGLYLISKSSRYRDFFCMFFGSSSNKLEWLTLNRAFVFRAIPQSGSLACLERGQGATNRGAHN